MKILTPTALLAEAAELLAKVREDIVVVGAVALEVALADAEAVAITPTRDVDVVVSAERADAVVSQLEEANLRRSDVPHERGFTWVRGDLKVQLVRPFHPFPSPVADRLPTNPVFSMARRAAHHLVLAFPDDPDAPRLTCANAACVLALKQAAFGRTRPLDHTPVERDFHDAYLLISQVPDAVLADLALAEYEVKRRATDAISAARNGRRGDGRGRSPDRAPR